MVLRRPYNNIFVAMKNPLSSIFCVILFVAAGFAQENRPIVDVYKEKLADMLVANDGEKVKNAQQDFQKLCFQAGAPGQEKDRKELVGLMLQTMEDPQAAAAHGWLIRQVGRLGDGSAAATIGKFLDSDNDRIRDEALWALGNIPAPEAVKVLTDTLGKEKDADKVAALKQAIAYHKPREAVAIKSLDEILKILSGTDEKAWDAALPHVAWLEKANIASVPFFKERFGKLAPRAKVLLIDALAVVKDRSAIPLAIDAAKSDDEETKLAGYRALGEIGDKSILPQLVRTVQEKDRFGNTVRDSLCRLNFDGADQVLIDAFDKSTDNGVKTELLEVLRKRKGKIAIPVFEKALSSDDEGLRRRSISALESIAEASAIAPLIDRFFAEKKSDTREAIERAIVTISSRYEDEDGRGQALCDEIAKRSLDEQGILLPLLGRIGGSASKKFVREQFANPALQDAAFKSLCVWPDASVTDELYQFASNSGDSRNKEATRAYLRVITLRTDRSPKESKQLFDKGMELAKTVEDKKFLLTRVETARSREVFEFAAPYLDDADLQQEACRAVCDMANDHNFYMGHRKIIDPCLDKVVAIAKDKKLVERAQRYKERR